MLVSHKHKLVIATPTKTGTTSLEHAVKLHVRNGGDEVEIASEIHPRRQHRMVVPAGCSKYKRYIVLRDPHARWLSVYRYLRKPWNQWGGRDIQGREWPGRNGDVTTRIERDPMTFSEFLHFIADKREEHVSRRPPLTQPNAYRAPWVWLDGLDVSVGALAFANPKATRPIKGIWTENLWADFSAVLPAFEEVGAHANRSGVPISQSVVEQYESQGLCSPRQKAPKGCDCGACRVGIKLEAKSIRDT